MEPFRELGGAFQADSRGEDGTLQVRAPLFRARVSPSRNAVPRFILECGVDFMKRSQQMQYYRLSIQVLLTDMLREVPGPRTDMLTL